MVSTPSKINLFLKVTERCEDSYHHIETLFMPLDNPADNIRIDFDSAPEISINCNTPGVPCNQSNICWKAADVYARKYNIAPSWNIYIEKNIPVAAGMGGGSSDAAAVLRILNDYYQKAGNKELAAIALKCGADVPFFLNPRPALASGRGEVFSYPELEFKKIPLLLVNPGFPISAAWAYQNLSTENIGELPDNFTGKFLDALEKRDLKALAGMVRNDLAIAAYKKFPVLSILKQELTGSGAVVAEITGSGPTLFALFDKASECRETADILKNKHPRMTVIESSI
jgi:4-diphosphocytidyl-2-C-methyl-D-erythritol kinase